MSQFIQLHLLTSYPPSNLNRDDLGRPKSAIMGGFERLRISSQSLKRAWRTSDIFEDVLGDQQGKRTKKIGNNIKDYLIVGGFTEKDAITWTSTIIKQFGKIKKSTPLEIEQLAHIAPEENKRLFHFLDKLIAEQRKPDKKTLTNVKKELNTLRARPKAVDIAMFGRMLTSSPAHNVDAAIQVAHAITVNGVTIEDDFFTAVDDLNNPHEDTGAGHMGDTHFGAGVFYLYVCVNKTLLVENLQNDKDLANKTLAALVESIAKVAPTGKQNSFASRAYTSYILAEKGKKQPRSLSVAFLKPIRTSNYSKKSQLEKAIKALENQHNNFNQVYDNCADEFKIMNVEKVQGSLQNIIEFVTE